MDTVGAWPSFAAETAGQSEAIATNLTKTQGRFSEGSRPSFWRQVTGFQTYRNSLEELSFRAGVCGVIISDSQCSSFKCEILLRPIAQSLNYE